MKKPETSEIKAFQTKVWNFYKSEGRHTLPWRKTRDPYKILVSEMMLQQTQVDRVIPKYKAFLTAFPNVGALARASTADVLKLWSGLGYNRRALFLKRAAGAIVSDFGGTFPKDAETLETLPGVGPYTARAVATFSHGASYIFIETNIRSVFIFEFFSSKKSLPASGRVPDAELFPLIEQALPGAAKNGGVREWYYALMDYGVHLKKTRPNPSRRSAHHTKQSAFKGSLREIRGAVLRALAREASVTVASLVKGKEPKETERVRGVLKALEREGFIIRKGSRISVKNS